MIRSEGTERAPFSSGSGMRRYGVEVDSRRNTIQFLTLQKSRKRNTCWAWIAAFSLPLDMKGLTTLWTKTKHGEMNIERRNSVYTQTPHYSKARAIHNGKTLVPPGNANLPSKPLGPPK
jgi:hypothetical protein